MKIQVDVLNVPAQGDAQGCTKIYENVADAVSVVHQMCADNNPPYGIQISLDGENYQDVRLSDFV
jgi:hypothetical protein